MIEKTTKNVVKYSTPRCDIEITTIPSEKSFKSNLESIFIDLTDNSSLYISGRCCCEDFIDLCKQISSEY